jgi:hypothetical protein
MSEHAELLERFRRGAELLAFAMTGAAGAEVDFKPAPDKWCVRQIVCHLADGEIVVAMRLRQVIAEDNPTLQGYDQNAWAEKLDWMKLKPSHVIDNFRRLRSDNYELLKDLPDEAFARTGNHSERGPMTLLDLVRTYTEHAENHIMQIRSVRAAYKESKAKAV